MLSIVNARGVPGTAGTIVRLPDGTRCLLTCYHVLFGGGARIGDKVLTIEEGKGRKRFIEIGRTIRGWIGSVTHEEQHCFIDCGIAALNEDAYLSSLVNETFREARVSGVGRAELGARVWKDGRITGITYGVVADAVHYDRPFIEQRTYEAPGQLLIRPERAEEYFSAAGESGAAVIDEQDRIVGFLWGLNPCGEGVAFPAAAALRHLGVTLDRSSQQAPSLSLREVPP